MQSLDKTNLSEFECRVKINFLIESIVNMEKQIKKLEDEQSKLGYDIYIKINVPLIQQLQKSIELLNDEMKEYRTVINMINDKEREERMKNSLNLENIKDKMRAELRAELREELRAEVKSEIKDAIDEEKVKLNIQSGRGPVNGMYSDMSNMNTFGGMTNPFGAFSNIGSANAMYTKNAINAWHAMNVMSAMNNMNPMYSTNGIFTNGVPRYHDPTLQPNQVGIIANPFTKELICVTNKRSNTNPMKNNYESYVLFN